LLGIIYGVVKEVRDNVRKQREVGWAGMVRRAGAVLLGMGLFIVLLGVIFLVLPPKEGDSLARLEKRHIGGLVMIVAGSYLAVSGAFLRYEAYLGLGVGSFCAVLLLSSWAMQLFKEPQTVSGGVFLHLVFVFVFGAIGAGVQAWRVTARGHGRAFLGGFALGGLLYLVVMVVFLVFFAPRVQRNREALEREKQQQQSSRANPSRRPSCSGGLALKWDAEDLNLARARPAAC
jgi:hypothetical protein